MSLPRNCVLYKAPPPSPSPSSSTDQTKQTASLKSASSHRNKPSIHNIHTTVLTMHATILLTTLLTLLSPATATPLKRDEVYHGISLYFITDISGQPYT